MAREAPHRRPGSSEAWLHLVGDEQSLTFVHELHGVGQEAGRVGIDAIARKDGVHQQRSKAEAASLEIGDRCGNAVGKALAGIADRIAIHLGCGNCPHVGRQRLTGTRGRRDIGHCGAIAVIGGLRDNEAHPPGCHFRDP
ncbi:hypothetical protein ACVIIZ_000712 [Bradyrhizobium sp. USDA 4523]